MDHSLQSRLHVVEMLEDLLDEGAVILISKDRVPMSFKDHVREYIASRSTEGYLGKHGSAMTLEGVIEELTDNPRRKICPRPSCLFQGRPVPLHHFGKDSDAADGHANVCRKCESTRINDLLKKKRNSVPATGHENKVSKASAEIEGVINGHVAEVHDDFDG